MASCIPVLRVLFRELHGGTMRRAREGSVSGSYKPARSLWASAGRKSMPRCPNHNSVVVANQAGHGRIGSRSWGWGFDQIASEDWGQDVERQNPSGPAEPAGGVNASRERILSSDPQPLAVLPTATSMSRTGGVIIQTREFEVRYEGRNSREGGVE